MISHSHCCIAVLITGGNVDLLSVLLGETAELYHPSSGNICTLPKLPHRRSDHTQNSDGLLCGGYEGRHIADGCIQWNTGTWVTTTILDVKRDRHLAWNRGNKGTYLMGNWVEENSLTTTLIKPDGTQEEGFRLKYDVR